MGICYNKSYEREFVNLMSKLGLDSHRIAGSGSGKEAVCDCILFFDKKTYLVEVKATKEEKFYFRKNVREQLNEMIKVCSRNGLIPVLAVKFKRRGWNILEVKNFENFSFDERRKVNANKREDFVIA